MPSYIATYIVSGGEISVSTDGTQLLSSVIGQEAYLYIQDGNVQYIIDLGAYMLHEKNLNYTAQLQAIATSLTDFQIAGYESSAIPLVDPNTGAFDNRLDVYDAYITGDVQVQWTLIDTPDIRDDLYSRDQLNDLVISSATKDFSNCFVSVNGVFHKTYFFNKELYVEGGFSNIKTAKQNKVAIYDTASLGGHIIVPITSDNIDASNTNPFAGVTLTFPNMDFTGMTVLLVLNGYLYALDDTYQLINTNRVKIDICKMDLLNQFLHDPNTSYVLNNTAVVAAETSSSVVPDVVDEITYYLESVWPGAYANPVTNVNLITFSLPDESIPSLTVGDEITNFLTNWPVAVPDGAQVMFGQYQMYTAPTTIVTTLPFSDFTDPRWIYALLRQKNTFLIAINNPAVYKRTYDLTRMQIPAQYSVYSQDTPRGILQYNGNWSLPYLMYTEDPGSFHDFSIDYSKKQRDVYKTMINPQFIPSPKLDVLADCNYPVRLLELYSPAA